MPCVVACPAAAAGPRAHDQQPVWALQVLASEAPGRSSTRPTAPLPGAGALRDPAAMDGGAALSGTVGPVLDPVFSLRQRIRVQPERPPSWRSPPPRRKTGTKPWRWPPGSAAGDRGPRLRAEHRERCGAAGRAGPDAADAALFSGWRRPSSLRARPAVARVRRGIVSANRTPGRTPSPATCQSRWCESERTATWKWRGRSCRHRVLAPLRARGRTWSFCTTMARATNCSRLEDLVLGPTAELVDRPGGVFLRDASRMSADDATLLEAAARLILRGVMVRWPRSWAGRWRTLRLPPAPTGRPRRQWSPGLAGRGSALLFDNGLGGFTADGRVRHHFASRRATAGAVEQCARQPRLRLPGHRGRRLHLGGQQPDESAHALEQRSRERPAQRGRLPPRRGDRGVLVADAGPRGGEATTSSVMARATAASREPATAWNRTSSS